MDVTYSFTNDNELIIEYKGTTDKTTIVNMTNHGFFSLAGIANPTPTIEKLQCQINADYFIPIDNTSIPTGEIKPVKGTPFDFTTSREIGERIDADDEQTQNGAGYDHCFVLNKREVGELSFAAKIYEPVSGRTMKFIPPNLEFKYTRIIGLTDTRDNWEQYLHVEAQFALKPNISPILPIAPTFRL